MRQGDDVSPPFRTSLYGTQGEVEGFSIPGPVNVTPSRAHTNGQSPSEGNGLDRGGAVFPLYNVSDHNETLVGRNGVEPGDRLGQNLFPLSAVLAHAVQVVEIPLGDLKINSS